jgi:hypothetical protein
VILDAHVQDVDLPQPCRVAGEHRHALAASRLGVQPRLDACRFARELVGCGFRERLSRRLNEVLEDDPRHPSHLESRIEVQVGAEDSRPARVDSLEALDLFLA